MKPEKVYTKDVAGKASKWEVDCEVYSHYADFKAYSFCVDQDGERHYGEMMPFDSKSKVDTFLEGTVKWDGCVDYSYTENTNDCCLHGCSLTDLNDYHLLVSTLYKDLFMEIPNRDESVIDWEDK